MQPDDSAIWSHLDYTLVIQSLRIRDHDASGLSEISPVATVHVHVGAKPTKFRYVMTARLLDTSVYVSRESTVRLSY